MPAWSPEIANEFIRMAATDGRAFDQMKLQELVYIAHGWCLAITGQPLTGDRPEALEHGPEYRRMSQALLQWGVDPVTQEIDFDELDGSNLDATRHTNALLFAVERRILARIYAEYGRLHRSQLAGITRADDSPWARIFADGGGNRCEIHHELIRKQFAEIVAKFGQ